MVRAGPYLAGARASVPFVVATLELGVFFGLLAGSLGWGILVPIAFSIVAVSASAKNLTNVKNIDGGYEFIVAPTQ